MWGEPKRADAFATSLEKLCRTPRAAFIALLRSQAVFVRDDRGSEILEYALVLSLFALICIVTINLMGVSANKSVETNQTNFTNSFVNGY